jgi:hypothetical protein
MPPKVEAFREKQPPDIGEHAQKYIEKSYAELLTTPIEERGSYSEILFDHLTPSVMVAFMDEVGTNLINDDALLAMKISLDIKDAIINYVEPDENHTTNPEFVHRTDALGSILRYGRKLHKKQRDGELWATQATAGPYDIREVCFLSYKLAEEMLGLQTYRKFKAFLRIFEVAQLGEVK